MPCTVDSIPASYSIGPEFRSRIGNRVSWLRYSVVLLCPYSQTPRYHYKLGYGIFIPRPFQFIVLLRPGPRLFVTLRNKLIFYGEELLVPRPSPKLEGHPLSAVRDCLFNIFAATLHIWRPSPPSATWGRVMPWWQAIHLSWLHNLYSSPIIIKSRRMIWARHVAWIWKKRNAYRILVGKPKGKETTRKTLPIFIPPLLHNHHHHLGLVQQANIDRSTKWTQSHPTKNNNNKKSQTLQRFRKFWRTHSESTVTPCLILNEYKTLH
jgi:hypothetical protein